MLAGKSIVVIGAVDVIAPHSSSEQSAWTIARTLQYTESIGYPREIRLGAPRVVFEQL